MRASARLAALWLLAAGCVDPLVVGDQPACEPQCPEGQHCHPELEQCVQCTIDEECTDRPHAPYCEGFGCVQCRDDGDCAGGRHCASGACVECTVDADCNTGLETFERHVCELGACVDSF